MADTEKQPEHAAADKPDADALALAEQAEAEAAEAEALAAAARARARAIRLRREAAEADKRDDDATSTATEVTTTAESPEPAELTATSSGSARRIPGIGTALTTAAIIGICALLGASGYMAWHHRNVVEQGRQAADFTAAAKHCVVNLTSLDFNRAKDDVQRVLDSSTGEFRDDFQKRAADFTSVVQQSKVVTEGSVPVAAVESIDKDSAVVLMLVNERVTNAAGAKEAPRSFRLRVSVTRDGDQIKMSKVEFVL